jgi:ribonucleoside-diphosphate reductase alpha chain
MDAHGLYFIQSKYLLPGETPWDAYVRIAVAAAQRLNKPRLANKFFELMWKGWMGPASPVLANMGTNRGLPISCNSLHVADSLEGIFNSNQELAHLSSKGAGVGIYVGDIRPRGTRIKSGAMSSGVIPWCKVYDSTTVSVSQSGVRRGASAFYLPFSHGDIKAFINMRRPTGDENLRCMNTHHAVVLTDEDMQKIATESEARELFQDILRCRVETGEPYLMFVDNVNKVNPLGYEKNNLKVKTSNICSEITAYTDPEHTFVCCLSSMNLAKWDEWKDTKAVYYATWFLDGVMQEYIDRAKNLPHFNNAIRFATKSRMLGLGAMGYHTLLQKNMLPFGSFGADLLNRAIFTHMASESNKASRDMAIEYGEPEWCKGTGTRHTHTLSIAPTVSNSAICGNISPGIEPWAANNFEKKSAVGTLFMHNKQLEALLRERGKNTEEVWDSITSHAGSVQHLDCLTKEEKEVFLTAREINQMDIIKSAAARQQCMDKYRQGQAQSVNLFFHADADETYVAKVHYSAWKLGLKTLYYYRSQSVSSADLPPSTQSALENISQGIAEECTACHG